MSPITNGHVPRWSLTRCAPWSCRPAGRREKGNIAPAHDRHAHLLCDAVAGPHLDGSVGCRRERLRRGGRFRACAGIELASAYRGLVKELKNQKLRSKPRTPGQLAAHSRRRDGRQRHRRPAFRQRRCSARVSARHGARGLSRAFAALAPYVRFDDIFSIFSSSDPQSRRYVFPVSAEILWAAR